MAVATATQHFFSKHSVEAIIHAPNSATANEIVTPDGGTTDKWVDMRDYEGFAMAVMLTIIGSSSQIDDIKIVAASDTAGADETEIKTVDVTADALGDWAVLECSAEELAQAGASSDLDLRYVAGKIGVTHANDEAAVTYIRFGATFPALDLTAATTIS